MSDKKSSTGSDIYTEEYMKNLELKHTRLVLNDLLVGIRREESVIIDNYLPRLRKTTITKFMKEGSSSVFIYPKQLYRTVSIIGIMTNFNKNVKYKVLHLSMLLDIWYNTETLMNKPDILGSDILIIHGPIIEKSYENRTEALIDVINIRKTMHKTTWLFIEGTQTGFEEKHKKLKDYVDSVILLENIIK